MLIQLYQQQWPMLMQPAIHRGQWPMLELARQFSVVGNFTDNYFGSSFDCGVVAKAAQYLW